MRRRSRTLCQNAARPRRRSCPLSVERVEARLLLATFTVTNTLDDTNPGSLRWAIGEVNSDSADSASSPDEILFNIPTSDPSFNAATGAWTIAPQSEPLPSVTAPAVINGTSQPGYKGLPLIRISGAELVGATADGLTVTAGDSLVAGLVISGFTGNGITLRGGGSNFVVACFIGTDETGTSASANSSAGVLIDNSLGNTIRANLISGNHNGIVISGPGASGSVIVGNFIGIDLTGANSLPNLVNGIDVLSAPGTTIGGTAGSDRNIISGNEGNGIEISDTGSANTVVEGNFIGTNLQGTKDIANLEEGVFVLDATGARIGGPGKGQGNLISGNDGYGVEVDSFKTGGADTNATIQGNFIGTDVKGTSDIGNLKGGVDIVEVRGNIVGGADAGDRNVVSGNFGNGITVALKASANIIQGNYVGVDVSGKTTVLNLGEGVEISSSATNNTIGGTTALEANVISGNGSDGVNIEAFATNNTVLGNLIGTNRAGAILPNLGNGVHIQSNNNIIGGTTPGARNVISDSGLNGVLIESTATGIVIEGNYIGLDPSGERSLANFGDGVFVHLSSGNTIGGSSSGARNVISANLGSGIRVLLFEESANDKIEGNFIGTDAAGGLAIGNLGDGVLISAPDTSVTGNLISGNFSNGLDLGNDATGTFVTGNLIGVDHTGKVALGNSLNGVFINGATLFPASGNTIGGTTTGDANVISGNHLVGILVSGSRAFSNVIEGNRIGSDSDGELPVPNTQGGVVINTAATSNLVGGTAPGAGNLISGNGLNGVTVSGPQTTKNLIRGNDIGTDRLGVAALQNARSGVVIDDAPGNSVGGTAPGAGNLISGNLRDGIEIDNANAIGNLVEANTIGADFGRHKALPNGEDGVAIDGAPGNTIGGLSSSASNLISGNRGNGISVRSTSMEAILGNLVGTDGTGARSLGNEGDGVLLDFSSGNAIGGTAHGAGNVITASGQAGVEVRGETSTHNAVQGNLIGPDLSGELLVGDAANPGNLIGVDLNDAPDNTVGGPTPAARNVISGNSRADGTGVGVEILGAQATGNIIVGDFIGLDASGTQSLRNDTGALINGAAHNLIGGLTTVPGTGPGNVISGYILPNNPNNGSGIMIIGLGSSSNLVEGNLIGTDASGTRTLVADKADAGILINDTSGNNTIGGTSAAARNVISGFKAGIEIFAAQSAANPLPGSMIEGNFIGTDSTGTVGLGNQVGVYINGVPSNTIGGTAANAGNLISDNMIAIYLFAGTATRNQIQGNLIGLDATRRPLGNYIGIFLDAASSNTIGGTTAGARNVISGNMNLVHPDGSIDGSTGIYFFNGAASNVVQGNFIGTNINGKPGKGFGQGDYGVLLFNAPNNTIPRSGKRGNRIAGSGIAAVREFTGTTSTGQSTRKKSPGNTQRHSRSTPAGPTKLLTAARTGASRHHHAH